MPPVRRAVALLVLAAVSAGCSTTSWRTLDALPDTRGSRRPDAVRLTLGDGTVTLLRRPTVRRDSIVGLGADGRWTPVAESDVAQFDVTSRRLTPGGRTAVRVLGVAAGAAAVAAAVLWAVVASSVDG